MAPLPTHPLTSTATYPLLALFAVLKVTESIGPAI